MTDFTLMLRRLVQGEDLEEIQTAQMIGDIMDGKSSPVQAAALLSAMAAKGETVREIVGAARAMRERSLHVEHELPLVLDVCGTGGDGANTINVSTCVAFVLAAAGVPVAKHGNRAASSSCGSADVLEACGVTIDIEPGQAARMLAETQFTFMFAQRYHPAMKNVAPVRRELGIRTMFNVLGPLTNPARATHQVVGVAQDSHVRLVGEALSALGVRRGAVVHADNGMDEVAGDGATHIYAFNGEVVSESYLYPRDFDIDIPLSAIQGGSVGVNVGALHAVLRGEPIAAGKVVALNAALALQVAGHSEDLATGFAHASEILASGRAYRIFERVRRFEHA
ncbi:MAG: anthranilate phosphoribosyltransferase [Candidatus Eremiobacteraeota bacterium]|nr:anthranilate phosphoribosyltransferase [Candidatus Eremiobacteraeota bacterium]